MNTPLVLLIFNRPDLTRRVFEVIKRIKPKQLFIISDGPRKDSIEDKQLITNTRNVVKNINWQCKVYRKYSLKNLGCRESVSDGLNWVFTKVDKAIILEDDCVPDPTFFRYCEELLKKYEKDDKVMMISGNNYIGKQSAYSYGFCRHSLIWGWATWKRAWVSYNQTYTSGLQSLDKEYDRLSQMMPKSRLLAIQKTLQGKIDTWDYVWQLAILLHNGLCIFPMRNLVQNIGFGKKATHTKRITFHTLIKAQPLSFPLIHPKKISVDPLFDRLIAKTYQPFYMMLDILKHYLIRV